MYQVMVRDGFDPELLVMQVFFVEEEAAKQFKQDIKNKYENYFPQLFYVEPIDYKDAIAIANDTLRTRENSNT